MDWLDLLAVQGTLKSLLQHYSSKASILQHSAFFMVQLSHPCVTTGKIIALTTRTFVCKVMSLLFNILSRFVIAFLPRSIIFSFQGCSLPTCEWLPKKKNKRERLTHSFPKAGPSRSYFARLKPLFTLLPHCLSLSLLPFAFSSPLLLSLWHPDHDKTVTLRLHLPSSWSANSLNKVVFFALTHRLSDLLDCHEVNRVRLDLVINSLQPSTAEYTHVCVSHLVVFGSLQPHGL